MPVPSEESAQSTRKLIADEIYDSLRKMIVEGDLEPGESLREVELSEYFQASRTPVHEAIAKLALHDFVDLQPQRGGKVAAMSVKSFRESFEMNTAIVGFIIREAIPLLTDEDRELLRGYIRQAETGPRVDLIQYDNNAYLEAIRVLERRYDNTFMSETLERSWPHIFRAFNMHKEASAKLYEDRLAFVQALITGSLNGDTQQVEATFALYRDHVLETFSEAMGTELDREKV